MSAGGKRSGRRGRLCLLALLTSAAGAGWYAAARTEARPAPFRRAWWYWHHPFRLSSDEAARLRGAGCERLYVHAGDLAARGGTLILTRPQRFESTPPCDLFLVLRVHPAAHDLLLGPAGAKEVAARLAALPAPAGVSGVQLDADVPTARLAEYARMLSTLRELLPQPWELSITALPDWLRSPDYPKLCASVHEIAPQFYGNRWPRSDQPLPPLWETDSLVEQVRRSAVGPARVWVGLPSYGRCFVRDQEGRTLGVRHDLDPANLLEEHPDLAVIRADTRRSKDGMGLEDTLALRAERDTRAGLAFLAGGDTFWFQWPRVEALEAVTRTLAHRPPRNVAGVCFFRWPDPAEPLSVNPPDRPPDAVDLQLTARPDARGTTVLLANRGADAPLLPEGVRVEVETRGALLDTSLPVEYRRGEAPCSPLRADRAVISHPALRPGATWEVCRLPDPEDEVTVRAHWRDGRGVPRTVSVKVPAAHGATDSGGGRR